MSKEISFILEPDEGRVTVESSGASSEISNEIKKDLGKSVNVNCGRPQTFEKPDFGDKEGKKSDDKTTVDVEGFIYLYRLYHHSTVDGPGRRSVLQFAGCSIRCPGCYVPETHERANGNLTLIDEIVAEIVKERSNHDGVTILGGEPFDQIDGLLGLVTKLRGLDFHITIYSGYRFEDLIGRKSKKFRQVLKNTNLLIDGAFERELVNHAGEYRGSENQRLIFQSVV